MLNFGLKADFCYGVLCDVLARRLVWTHLCYGVLCDVLAGVLCVWLFANFQLLGVLCDVLAGRLVWTHLCTGVLGDVLANLLTNRSVANTVRNRPFMFKEILKGTYPKTSHKTRVL